MMRWLAPIIVASILAFSVVASVFHDYPHVTVALYNFLALAGQTSLVMFFLLTPVFAIMFLVRLHFIGSYRIELIDKDYDAYKKLPSYDAMLWRFWIWSFDKFLDEKYPPEDG